MLSHHGKERHIVRTPHFPTRRTPGFPRQEPDCQVSRRIAKGRRAPRQCSWRRGLRIRGALVAISVTLTAGCGTMRDGRPWGEVKLWPGFAQLGKSAVDAAGDPNTWVPAAGAMVFGVTGWDRNVSSWASRKTPVFGSRSAAKKASDTLVEVESLAMYASALGTPSGDEPLPWVLHKAGGLVVGLVAHGVALSVTGGIKNTAGRKRPDESNWESFPSGHATSAFVYASLSRRNLDATHVPPLAREVLDGGLTLTAAAAAWARVEGEKHYPSDVLAGAAIGSFVGALFNDAFLGGPDGPVSVGVWPEHDHALLALQLRF